MSLVAEETREPLPLANGWHQIPGDGLPGDETKRPAYYGKRWKVFVYILNGYPVGAEGSLEDDWAYRYSKRTCGSYERETLHEFEAAGDFSVYELLAKICGMLGPEVDEWADEFELNS